MKILKTSLGLLTTAAICIGTTTWAAEDEWGEWHSLFDGHSFAGWKLFDRAGPPPRGWQIENGILKKIGGVRGGNLASEQTYEEFELAWEWRLPKGAFEIVAGRSARSKILVIAGEPAALEARLVAWLRDSAARGPD